MSVGATPSKDIACHAIHKFTCVAFISGQLLRRPRTIFVLITRYLDGYEFGGARSGLKA